MLVSKLQKITTKIAILLTIAGFLSVSQGIIICFEPDNNYKLEFKVAPCKIETKKSNNKLEKKDIFTLQNQACTDYELNLAFSIKKLANNFISPALQTNSDNFSYFSEKLLSKAWKYKPPIQSPITKNLSTVILLI